MWKVVSDLAPDCVNQRATPPSFIPIFLSCYHFIKHTDRIGGSANCSSVVQV